MQAEKIDTNTTGADLVHRAGLFWDARETTRLTFAQAEAHIAAMNAAGYGGATNWRLPTYHELTGLVDVTRFDPAIDVNAFPNCESDWYWTGTPAAYSPADYAWIVDFGYGNADWLHHGGHAFVRAVRPSQ